MYFGGGKVEILVESLIKHAPSEHVARSAPPRGAGEGGGEGFIFRNVTYCYSFIILLCGADMICPYFQLHNS